MNKNSRIYIAGHLGLVGSAITRKLETDGYNNLILRTHKELDLTQQTDLEAFFDREKPEYVFLAAAKVGGIWANNTYPAEFIYSNLAIQTNILHAAWKVGVKRLLFLGSSCIYPRECPQPMKEAHLLTGPLESTNRSYAVAKIAGVIQCESYNRQYGTRFLAVMPTNLYGPNDNYDLEDSHVLPALIRKFHLAKLATQGDWVGMAKDESLYGPIPKDIRADLIVIAESKGHHVPDTYKPDALNSTRSAAITLWGTGNPRREFLYVDDLADACHFLIDLSDDQIDTLLNPRSNTLGPAPDSMPLINIGSGKDRNIRELAGLVAGLVGFDGKVQWDETKPDGVPRKLLDVSRIGTLGWRSKISLREGIQYAYQDYLKKF